MIDSKLFRPALLSAALLTGPAGAASLGEITLLSPIGEPLRAIIPLQGADNTLKADCFSLAPGSASDLPVVAGVHIRLARVGENTRLIIIGSKPIAEPVFVINLRAACGIDLQREYVLLPGPPIINPASTADSGGDLSSSASRRQYPANDDAFGSKQATEAARHTTKRPAPRQRQAPTEQPAGTRPPATLAGLAAGKDRIILGSALDELPPPGAGQVLEERLLKMETSLHLLNDQVDKLHKALSLGNEARAIQDKLRSVGAAPGLAVATPPAAVEAGTRDDHVGWIELLLGILVGGSVSAGVAHLVSRRHDRRQVILPAAPTVKPKKPRRPARAGA